MIRIVLASHSDLAESLLRTGKMICGSDLMNNVTCFTLKENGEGIDELRAQCQSFLEQNLNEQFLIFTDMLGATPFNVCCSVFCNSQYRIITGMNLPMIIDCSINKQFLTLDELAEKAMESGKEGIANIQFDMNTCVDKSEEDFL